MQYDVFISYSSKDGASAANTICDALENRGVKCWIAHRDIPGGADYPDEIMKGIRSSKMLVLVFSADADRSLDVGREVHGAARYRKPIYPVRIQDVEPTGDIEYYTSSLQWLDAFPPPLENHLERLIRNVKQLLGVSPQPLAETGSHVLPPPPRSSWLIKLRDAIRPSWVATALGGLILLAIAIWFFKPIDGTNVNVTVAASPLPPVVSDPPTTTGRPNNNSTPVPTNTTTVVGPSHPPTPSPPTPQPRSLEDTFADSIWSCRRGNTDEFIFSFFRGDMFQYQARHPPQDVRQGTWRLDGNTVRAQRTSSNGSVEVYIGRIQGDRGDRIEGEVIDPDPESPPGTPWNCTRDQ